MKNLCKDKEMRTFRNHLCNIKWFWLFAAFAFANIVLGIFLISETLIVAMSPPVLMENQLDKSLYTRSQFVYLDVKSVSRWIYDYAPTNSRMRQTASYFFEVLDAKDRRFIVQIPKNYGNRNPEIFDDLRCIDSKATYRIYGCVKPISNGVVDGIVGENPILHSRTDYRETYGYTVLQIQDRPSPNISFPIMLVVFWLFSTAVLYWQMTKGFQESIKRANLNKEIDVLLVDWKHADKTYQGRGFCLGEKYMYCMNGGFFFKYTEISHFEVGADRQTKRQWTDTTWPSLFVAELKNGRKIRIGTNDKPLADHELRRTVMIQIRQKMSGTEETEQK